MSFDEVSNALGVQGHPGHAYQDNSTVTLYGVTVARGDYTMTYNVDSQDIALLVFDHGRLSGGALAKYENGEGQPPAIQHLL